MARRDLLTDSERHALFTVPATREALARHYMLSSRDLALIAERRSDTNQVGFAVQLALMRHPGFGFTLEGGAPDHLVAFMAEQIDVSASAFDTYAVRPATASVHAREVEQALGLRGPTNADLPLLIEAGAKAAWSTDRGLPIVVGIMEALRASGITLPSPSVIERAGIAGRAHARQHTYDALLACVPVESLAKLDATLAVDPKTSLTPLAWLREIATAPTPDNVRGLLDRLARVRDIGLPVTIGDAIHADRLRQFVREGRASSAQLIGSGVATASMQSRSFDSRAALSNGWTWTVDDGRPLTDLRLRRQLHQSPAMMTGGRFCGPHMEHEHRYGR